MGCIKKIKISFRFQVLGFRIKCLAFLFCVSLAFPLITDAAELKLSLPVSEIEVSQQFKADLFLDTENESINAVESRIVFPEELLEVKEIRDGNSIINFWVERPKATGNQIIFSGIIPGGYQETRGFLLSVVFQAKAEGEGAMEIRDAKVLLNDGKGTPTNVKISNFQFSVSKEV